MRQVPDTWLFEPWLMPQPLQIQLSLGDHLAAPVVDLATATREAKQRLHARRQQPEVRAGKKAVIEQHASRKPLPPRKKTAATPAVAQQLGFDF